jgi:hypothetical protein
MVVGSLKEYTGIRGDFHQLCNPIFCHVHSLQLADCLVLPFGEDLSTAGWIGSNKYAFSRLLPYLCSYLHNFAKTKFPNNPSKTVDCLSVCTGIERMVTTLYSLLSRVMQRCTSETLVNKVDDFVKLFCMRVFGFSQDTFFEKNTTSIQQVRPYYARRLICYYVCDLNQPSQVIFCPVLTYPSTFSCMALLGTSGTD